MTLTTEADIRSAIELHVALEGAQWHADENNFRDCLDQLAKATLNTLEILKIKTALITLENWEAFTWDKPTSTCYTSSTSTTTPSTTSDAPKNSSND